MENRRIDSCPICGSHLLRAAFAYGAPPEVEKHFTFTALNPYHRAYLRCGLCGHFTGTQSINVAALYGGDYMKSNYGDLTGIREAFARITALPPERSDNRGRVQRIHAFASSFLPGDVGGRRLLDVGSGLGVFPSAMQASGWECTAVDPDPLAAAHLEQDLRIRTLRGDFSKMAIQERFAAVTFNKVLEHVEDPIRMLGRAHSCLARGGFIYVEVPDAEDAARDGREREEFAIDHLHVFSLPSLVLMISRAGFDAVQVERLREPSTKYTLCAFAKARPAGDLRSG